MPRRVPHQLFIGRPLLWAMFVVCLVPAIAWAQPKHQANKPALRAETSELAILEPPDGAYFGVNLDWGTDTATAYSFRLGRTPFVFVRFFQFPFTQDDLIQLENFISQVAAQKGMAMLTLEPYNGLHLVTPEVARDLAIRLKAFNEAGIPLFVRFAHEMNGSWYSWSQKPAEYRNAFRLVADAVHEMTDQTAMVWAPNYGSGYPYHGGQYEAQPGTAAFDQLDTNDDGQLSMDDDMYAPYYPGDDAVDWVGMSLYHWGNTYPWGENEVPEADKFASQIRGTYNGLNGDERAVPDFYDVYVNQHGKPVSIPETAALYNTTVGGADARLIKRTWWSQVFSAETWNEFPRIKMINWFEWRKSEPEIGGATIDWGFSYDELLVDDFWQDVSTDNLLFASDPIQSTRVFLPYISLTS